MKSSTPTKASTPKKKLASSDSSPNVVKCSSASADKKKTTAEKVIKKNKKKNAEEVSKNNKKQQQKMETSNAASDNNRKKTKKKKEDEEEAQMCTFPMARVGRLIKSGEFGTDNIRPSQDAVFLVNNASEMFLNRFIKDAFTKASSPSPITKRSKNPPFLTYQHLSSAVSTGKPYEFLSDYVPEKVKAEEALKLWASIKSQ